MRISDWSSDVCSSDLEKTSHALLVGAILHVLYAEPDKSLRGVADFLSDPARPFERTLSAMLRTPHLGNAPHPVVASAAREMRSEEHTSELQSLMRISYAVFCLKKKT